MEPKSINEQNIWFDAHGAKNPILVAEINNEVCAGRRSANGQPLRYTIPQRFLFM